MLVSGGFDGTVKFWNARTWEQFRSVDLPDALPNGIAFTPNGKEVVIATLRKAPPPADRKDCVIYSLRADEANSELREFAKGHAGAAITIAVLKDGKTVVSGGGRTGEIGEIKVWDLPSGKLLGEFRGHSTVVEALAVAPDGRTLVSGAWATGKPGELHQWDAGGFRSIAAVPATIGPYVSSAAASPNGKILAIGGGNGEVRTFDMTDPTRPIQRQGILGKHASIGSIAFDASGKRFVTADDKGKVIVWDAEKTIPLKEWQASDKFIAFRAKFTPDGKSVVTAAGLWKEAKTPGEMRVWDPETGKEIARFPDQSAAVWDFAFLDGGKTLVSTQARNGTPGEAAVKVWDFATRAEKRSIDVPGGMRCLAVSPDEQYLAVANHSGETKLISTQTWQVTSTPPPHGKVVFRLGFSADSKMLSSISEDGSLGITRIQDQR
jgi:WD40 repeat protein